MSLTADVSGDPAEWARWCRLAPNLMRVDVASVRSVPALLDHEADAPQEYLYAGSVDAAVIAAAQRAIIATAALSDSTPNADTKCLRLDEAHNMPDADTKRMRLDEAKDEGNHEDEEESTPLLCVQLGDHTIDSLPFSAARMCGALDAVTGAGDPVAIPHTLHEHVVMPPTVSRSGLALLTQFPRLHTLNAHGACLRLLSRAELLDALMCAHALDARIMYDACLDVLAERLRDMDVPGIREYLGMTADVIPPVSTAVLGIGAWRWRWGAGANV